MNRLTEAQYQEISEARDAASSTRRPTVRAAGSPAVHAPSTSWTTASSALSTTWATMRPSCRPPASPMAGAPAASPRIAGLIRYLMRHRHTTPFEMCEIKFHVKLPIFVARQWIRHRTANVNEYSARYSDPGPGILHPRARASGRPIRDQPAGTRRRPEGRGGRRGPDDPARRCRTHYDHYCRDAERRRDGRSRPNPAARASPGNSRG